MPLPTVDGLSVRDHRVAFREWLSEQSDLQASVSCEPADLETAILQEQQLQQRLWDSGFGRRGWPAAYGGVGGTAVLRAATYEELTLAGLRVPQPSYTAETLCPALIRFAPSIAKLLLPGVLRGEEIWCQGFSEPEAGSDLASLRCRAEQIDGDSWSLTGQKVWTSFGHLSRRAAVLARTGESGHRGISMFLVDLEGQTVRANPIRANGGRNEFSELFFERHRVPASRLVGRVGQGWEVAMYLLQWERGMYAWQRQATLRARLESAVSKIRQRTDQPIGAAAALVRAWTSVSALRERSAATVGLLAEGESPGPAVSLDKVLLSHTEQLVMDACRSVEPLAFAFGPGVEAELSRSEWFYSRAATIYGGAVDVQRGIIAEHLLQLPRSPR